MSISRYIDNIDRIEGEIHKIRLASNYEIIHAEHYNSYMDFLNFFLNELFRVGIFEPVYVNDDDIIDVALIESLDSWISNGVLELIQSDVGRYLLQEYWFNLEIYDRFLRRIGRLINLIEYKIDPAFDVYVGKEILASEWNRRKEVIYEAHQTVRKYTTYPLPPADAYLARDEFNSFPSTNYWNLGVNQRGNISMVYDRLYFYRNSSLQLIKSITRSIPISTLTYLVVPYPYPISFSHSIFFRGVNPSYYYGYTFTKTGENNSLVVEYYTSDYSFVRRYLWRDPIRYHYISFEINYSGTAVYINGYRRHSHRFFPSTGFENRVEITYSATEPIDVDYIRVYDPTRIPIIVLPPEEEEP